MNVYGDEYAALQSQISVLELTKTSLEDSITTLESQKGDLEARVQTQSDEAVVNLA